MPKLGPGQPPVKTSYTLEPSDKTERGTTIEIKLKEGDKDFAESYRLRSIIHKHSDFVSFPIYLDDDSRTCQPPAGDLASIGIGTN